MNDQQPTQLRIGMSVALQQGKDSRLAALVTGPVYMGESGSQYVNLTVFPDGSGIPYCMAGVGPAQGPHGYGWVLP